ncbi:MAG: nuclear transport factor 2 family protein [Fibrella sp.]|nr:nuclear transport factor 2 family protein [Armatimonadota bacterium]
MRRSNAPSDACEIWSGFSVKTSYQKGEFFRLAEEFPNRLLPNGMKRDLPALLQAAERGQKVMTSHRYDILNMIASGNQVAIEFNWVGTLRQRNYASPRLCATWDRSVAPALAFLIHRNGRT